MVPTHKSFGAHDPFGPAVDFGLVIKFKLIVLKRVAQIFFNGFAFFDPFVHGGQEEAVIVAAFGLGGIHRHIGIFDQLFGIFTVLGEQGDTDAGG